MPMAGERSSSVRRETSSTSSSRRAGPMPTSTSQCVSNRSGGIVFRFSEGRYYVVRANALEDNFRFYYYDRGRRQIDGARVKAPALGQWHALRIRAEGDRIQGWLNDQALIDSRDERYKSGRVGLWTKADSVTAFDDLLVRPLNA
jgi:3-keto-disaccharide hydrolase